MTEKGYYPVGAIASLLELDVRRVQQLAKEGVIPKGRRGQYHLIDCVRGYIRFLRSTAAQKQREESPAGDSEAAKIRLVTAQARKAEMEVAVLEGELITVEDAAKGADEVFDRVRARLIAVPGKEAHRFVGLKKLQEAVKALGEVVDVALRELSGRNLEDEV